MKNKNRLIMKTLQKISLLFPDELVIRLKYWFLNGHLPDLKNPTTYNEKLLWLNLHYRNPILTDLVDKYKVREFVKEKIGEQYLIPLLGVYNSADEINLDKLPNKFVLKCNHDSGSVIICNDKNKFNLDVAKKSLNRCLKRNYYYHSREWAYKNCKPLIICEQFIETSDGKVPNDYKIFCLNGEPQMFFIASDRGKGTTKFDFYDMECNHLPVTQHYPNTPMATFKKPQKWDDMVRCAKILSAGFPQVRVDFYEDKEGNVIFGELTFIHFSGMHDFKPIEYNQKLGSIIDLSCLDKKYIK